MDKPVHIQFGVVGDYKLVHKFCTKLCVCVLKINSAVMVETFEVMFRRNGIQRLRGGMFIILLI
jgi:hypothetical protein